MVLVLAAAPALAAEPVVSVWYRGSPAGTPQADDLAAIKAAGFQAVTWPAAHASRLEELSALAGQAGLMVVLDPDVRAFELSQRLTVPVTRIGASHIAAVVWRAVSKGIRTISFDPGQSSGTGLASDKGLADWVAPAAALARQLSANAVLFDALRPTVTPPRYVSPRPPAVELTLVESPRAWVAIATNTGGFATSVDAQLPVGVPYAIWFFASIYVWASSGATIAAGH